MRPRRALMMAEERCENCIYFYQHYVRISPDGDNYMKCNCGHCRFPGIKYTRPDLVCDDFKARQV